MSASPRPLPENRRDELLRVATRLFGRRGFHGTSMGDIAEETGIQKASLYHWVDSKEDLLYQVLSGAVDSLIAQARTIAEDSSLDFSARLKKLVAIHANYTISHPDVMSVFLSEAKWLEGTRGRQVRDVRRTYHRIYEDLFFSAISAGEFAVPESLVAVYVNLLFAMTNQLPHWYRHESSYGPGEIADLISSLVLARIERPAD